MRKQQAEHPIEKVGEKLRTLMPWIAEGKMVDKSKNYMTEKIYIFDTTLRDGEQSPGASMNLEEKIQIAEILEEMKVDIIEAGFPIASNGDFEAVSEISKNIKKSTIAGLARAKIADIDRAWDAVKHASSSKNTHFYCYKSSSYEI